MKLWRIATDTPDYTSDDMTGTGAKISGGRWNRPGTAMLYCGTNISLAVLETFVHLKAGGLPLNRYLVEINVHDDVWNKAVDMRNPPVGWDAIPAGTVSLNTGDNWIRANTSALMVVPSVIVSEEYNVLINPLHSDTKTFQVRKVRKWTYDSRLGK
ncbi:RES family NAD+ phosphorylase [Massilia forsythiae]|uniref:RES family NAD+ phosphorylase n=1 Tax=Massilia forsythiae TaxID=2728020 RepID=A0A7Z2ZRK5_9BURK|nr:RES family NAD+ phosphorylase [Massilia forsythiae]QJD99258.1 RES family NAD+ phosphorylase [Massilia forsythiae]